MKPGQCWQAHGLSLAADTRSICGDWQHRQDSDAFTAASWKSLQSPDRRHKEKEAWVVSTWLFFFPLSKSFLVHPHVEHG